MTPRYAPAIYPVLAKSRIKRARLAKVRLKRADAAIANRAARAAAKKAERDAQAP